MVRKLISKNESIIVLSELGHIKEYPFIKEGDFIIIKNDERVELYQVEYIVRDDRLACNLIGLQINKEWVYTCTSSAVMRYVTELCAA